MSNLTRSWRDILIFYTQRRLLVIFLLGVASGYPWLIIGSSMSAWLNEIGVTRASIGYFGAVFAAYSINFLWSPLIDRIRLPVLTQWLGQRRSWILLCQVLVALGCFHLSTINLSEGLRYAGMVALFIAICSATQDIAIDAFRIDSIGVDEPSVQSAGAAMTTAGWWTGYGAIGAVPFFLSDMPNMDWPLIYKGMAVFMVVLSAGVWLGCEPKTARRQLQAESEVRYQRIAHANPQQTVLMMLLSGVFIVSAILAYHFPPGDLYIIGLWASFQILLLIQILRLLIRLHVSQHGHTDAMDAAIQRRDRVIAWIIVTMIEPIYEFFNRNGVRMALTVLLFVTLFKVGEAFLGRMSIVFYQEVGFSNTDIALYSKLTNWWITIVFSIVGSYVNMRFGIIKGLFIGGTAMAASNLMFSALALVGPDRTLFVAAVVVDGFTSAWSTVAFVAFISLLTNRAFTATQYALMASLGTLGRTVLGAYSGVVVDYLDGNWALFFALTTVMVIPSLLLLWTIRHKVYAMENANRQRSQQAARDP